jgi:hypothetical protein
VETLGVIAADDHGKGVLKAERLGDFEVEPFGVTLLNATVNVARVGGRRFVEDGGQGRAGVFDVEIEVAGEERLLAKERAAEIGFAIDVYSGAGFDVLGEKLGENDLLGEKFGADG